ncbi:MAG: hypothetical protein HYV54_01065 [Parcubacteria group bacterium]|nr:hypothetical protein [Parcubacteria group bacterium]
MKKIILIIAVVVILIGGYLVFNKSTPAEAPTDTNVTSGMPATPELERGEPAPGATVPEMIVETAAAVITYTDSGYTPASAKIKMGETVKFMNESSKNMWPASAQHPTHAVYPTTGGCLGSTFDACKSVSPGQSWSFKFDIKGDWKYHDHLTPKYFGGILVD